MCGSLPAYKLQRYAAAYLLLPMQAGMRGRACVHRFTSLLPLLAWLSLCFSPSTARNILGPVFRSPVRLFLLVLVWFVFCFCFFLFGFLVFVFLCLRVLFFLYVICGFFVLPSYHFFSLRVPPYHFALPRLWWPCCASGGMYVRAYLSLPMCAAYGVGYGHLSLGTRHQHQYGRYTFCSLCERA